jgi:hypothetical protein
MSNVNVTEHRRAQRRWLIAGASVVVPVAVVLFALPFQGGIWLLLALAGGTAASVALVELADRSEA